LNPTDILYKEGIMKITYGKSEPWNSGWRGWSDSIEVYVDSRQAGDLKASGNQKKWLVYQFVPTEPALSDVKIYPGIGIREAKKALTEAIMASAGCLRSVELD
jgi:hypothetical protein